MKQDKPKPRKKANVIQISSRKRVKQPAAKAPLRQERVERAYRELGITAQAVIDTPKIAHILEKLPGKPGHRGIKAAIEFLRGADDDLARKFLSLWDDLESIQALVPFEAFCVATGITTKRMLETVAGACFDQAEIATKLITAAAHPAVVDATVRGALNVRDGAADRKMIHLNKGFLPVPKNNTTILSGNAKQTNLQITDNSQTANVTYAVTEIANIEKSQGRIADRFNERLGMGASRYIGPGTTNGTEPELAEPAEVDD